jgi:hypothetical protein
MNKYFGETESSKDIYGLSVSEKKTTTKSMKVLLW